MHIVHIVLAGIMTDGASYQENLLSKYHRRLGHSVTVLTQRWSMNSEGQLVFDPRLPYENADGVKIVRLAMRGKENPRRKLKRFPDLYEELEREQPDMLFVHGCQFLDATVVARYARCNTVTMYVDNHADFSNSATGFLSRELLHKGLWRQMAHVLMPYTRMFYGVLPARVDFLKEIYALPSEKCELLLMGADDDDVTDERVSEWRTEFRGKFEIESKDFLIVTGGKIDSAKRQTLLLAEAVQNLKRNDVKLLIFGSVEPALRPELDRLCDGEIVRYVGWARNEDAYGYFSAADLIAFPGRHSVYWEQAAGVGRPMLLKYWPGTNHIDLGGNVRYLMCDSAEEIRGVLEELLGNPVAFDIMRMAAARVRTSFSYADIARKSISETSESSY